MKICSKIASDAISEHQILKIFSGEDPPNPPYGQTFSSKCHLSASNIQNLLPGGPKKAFQDRHLLQIPSRGIKYFFGEDPNPLVTDLLRMQSRRIYQNFLEMTPKAPKFRT